MCVGHTFPGLVSLIQFISILSNSFMGLLSYPYLFPVLSLATVVLIIHALVSESVYITSR